MMARLLLPLLLLANAGYFLWSQGLLRDWGLAPAAQTEPHRLAQQIRPELMRIGAAPNAEPATALSPATMPASAAASMAKPAEASAAAAAAAPGSATSASAATASSPAAPTSAQTQARP